MLKPQDIQEVAFAKAVFGGYDMAAVDDFLETLYTDYAALHRDNSVLKTKIKTLVDSVEEYRATEESMRKALIAAKKVGDDMIEQTKARCSAMLEEAGLARENQLKQAQAEAEELLSQARKKAEAILTEAQNRAGIMDLNIAAASVREDDILAEAKSRTLSFLANSRRLAQRQLEQLDQLEQLANDAVKLRAVAPETKESKPEEPEEAAEEAAEEPEPEEIPEE